MITEQEVVKYINENKDKMKPSTARFLTKLQSLEDILTKQRAELEELEKAVSKTRGAISMVLEFIAEEEGLLPADDTADNSTNSTK